MKAVAENVTPMSATRDKTELVETPFQRFRASFLPLRWRQLR